MRLLLLCLLAMSWSAPCCWAATATGDPTLGALIEKLVEKGVINREEAGALEQDLKKPVSAESDKDTLPQAGSEPAKPAKAKLKLPFEIKIRAQARFDAGDLLVGSNGRYQTENDLYLRRVRLEVDKEFHDPPLGKELDLNLTLEADRSDQTLRNGRRRDSSNDVGLQYLYGDWQFLDQFAVEVGKHKLPLLRAELTSSARQLLIERPVGTGVASDSLGDYHQAQVMVHGDFAGGAVRYYLSYLDGVASLGDVQQLDSEADSVQRRGWGEAMVARIELAPVAFLGGKRFVERKKDDTGIGAVSHLTLGLDGGFQQEIRYATGSVSDARLNSNVISADLAGRYVFANSGAVTAQAEYLYAKRDFNYRADEEPQGWYLQLGYLFPWELLRGKLEPAFRYELFDQDTIVNSGESGTKERLYSIGLNHYLLAHSIKWSYNFVHTRFDRGIAEAPNTPNRNVHQLLVQLYF